MLADTPHESSLVYWSPAHKAALSTPKKVFKDKRETLNPTKYRIRQLEFVELVTGSLLPTGNAKKGIKRQLSQLWCVVPEILGGGGKRKRCGSHGEPQDGWNYHVRRPFSDGFRVGRRYSLDDVILQTSICDLISSYFLSNSRHSRSPGWFEQGVNQDALYQPSIYLPKSFH